MPRQLRFHLSMKFRPLIASLITVMALSLQLTAKQPNVILIVTDDQGYGDIAAHGNPWLKTPKLDRLHHESVRLEDFHTDPVCTPTRAALMTGRHSTRVGAWAVTEGRQLLNADETTMANVFANSGYRTGMFGKWHLGDTYPYAPRFRGFQDVVRHLAGGIDEIGNPEGNNYFDDTLYRNGQPEKFTGYCTDIFFNETRRFVEENKDSPFFVYLPLNAMHGPFTVAPQYSDRFAAMGFPEREAKFYGMIENFDENLGRLFTTLETHDLAQDTIIIFLGDNGSAVGESPNLPAPGYNAGLRGKKGTVYEGGHRNACFVRWPAHLTAGLEIEQLTSVRDLLPTLIELCGLQSARSAAFDGKSIASLLTEKATTWPERTLFLERQSDQMTPAPVAPQPGNKSRYPTYAVLTERWRLSQGELYEIALDPGQAHNVASQHPDVVQDLHHRYLAYHADVSSHDSAWTPFLVGSEHENPTRLNVRDWHPVDGPVIWKKEQLGDDKIAVNGFWAIDVQQAGNYRIRLHRHPDDAPAPMNAVAAQLQVGNIKLQQQLLTHSTSATFEVTLDPGIHKLQTWLTDPTGTTRGAYYIEFTRL